MMSDSEQTPILQACGFRLRSDGTRNFILERKTEEGGWVNEGYYGKQFQKTLEVFASKVLLRELHQSPIEIQRTLERIERAIEQVPEIVEHDEIQDEYIPEHKR